MAGKKNEVAATGRAVAANVKRLREEQNLGYAELSRRLDEQADRDIPPLGLRRIESHERRVDADDLVALAVALSVSPLTLLTPGTLRIDANDPGNQASAYLPVAQAAQLHRVLGDWLTSRGVLLPAVSGSAGLNSPDAGFRGYARARRAPSETRSAPRESSSQRASHTKPTEGEIRCDTPSICPVLTRRP